MQTWIPPKRLFPGGLITGAQRMGSRCPGAQAFQLFGFAGKNSGYDR